MREAASREFQISPNQYQVFRFSVSRPTLYISMLATAPVNVFLVDSDGKYEYENGIDSFSAFRWGRRVSIDESVNVDPGTWYIIIEGRDDESRGRIKVYQQ